MPFSTGRLLRHRIVCQLGDQVGINVRHWRVQSQTATPPLEQAVVAALDGVIAPLYRNLIVSAASYRGSGLTQITPLPPGNEFVWTGNEAAGLETGDPLPSQTCGLLRFRGALSSRSARGRLFAPFPSEAINDSQGRPNGIYRGILVTLGNIFSTLQTFTALPGDITLEPVILNNPVLELYHPIISHTVALDWATQRRRGRLAGFDALPF